MLGVIQARQPVGSTRDATRNERKLLVQVHRHLELLPLRELAAFTLLVEIDFRSLQANALGLGPR